MNFNRKKDNKDNEDGGDSSQPDMTNSFVFKLPFAGSSLGSTGETGMDLKWLTTQEKMVNELFKVFLDSYNKFIDNNQCSADILRAHFEVIKTLSNYQIVLKEQQNKRQGYIENESELQEIMSQMEVFLKNFKERP